jgi:RHS repeat-associated protein
VFTYANNSNILNSIEESNTTDTTNISYEYDATGNIVKDDKHTYTYDSRNRLTAIDSNVTYEYNYDNKRVSKTVNGVKTYFVYDGHMLVGEYQLNLSNDSRQEFVYLNSTPIATLKPQENYRVYSDHLDISRRVTTDDEKAEVLWEWESKPFGESLADNDVDGDGKEFVQNLRFPGQYFDVETSTHYNINRDYNPVAGRYIQSDPIGFDGGVNGFGYASDTPIMGADPLGKFVVFIGGALDGTTDIVKEHVTKYTGNTYKKSSAYFYHYTWNSTIKSVIDSVKKSNPGEPIAMVGHSFGGDTATEFVQQYPGVVDALFTVDPVGWDIPSQADIHVNNYWYNIDAIPTDGWNLSDYIAYTGYEWGTDVLGVANYYASVDAHHGEFTKMMRAAGDRYLGSYSRNITPYFGHYGSGSW